MRALLRRLRAIARRVVSRRAFERDMDEEFRSHIVHRADDLEQRGLSRVSAERTARIEFGSTDWHKNEARAARGLRLWDAVVEAVFFAARGILHRPVQSAIVVFTLTLGIGINASVFTILDELALRARVDHDPSSFIRLFSSYRTDSTAPSFPSASTMNDFLAYSRQMKSLASIAGWQRAVVSMGARATPTPAELVSCGFFDVYGPVRPLAGRMLQPQDCAAKLPVAVVSSVVWRDELSSAPDVVGRVIRINGQVVRVIGVAPPFSSVQNDDALWLPYTLRGYLQLGTDDPASPDALHMFVDGRLAPGYSRADAFAEAKVITAQQDAASTGRRTAVVVTDGSLLRRPGNGLVVTGTLATVFVGLACLALVAFANVVSILLAIAHAREREMALRMALGAGAPRLAGMLVAESLALAMVAGVAATVITLRLPRVLFEWIVQRDITFSLAPDWRVFVFLLVTTTLAAAVAANAPIRAVLSLHLDAVLRGTSAGERRTPRRGSRLVGVQIGAAAALLIASIALTRLPHRVESAPLHFDAAHVVSLNLRAPQPANGWRAFHADLARTLGDIAGADGIAFGSATPAGDENTGAVQVTTSAGVRRTLPAITVSPEYFDVFGIRVQRGRGLRAADADCDAAICAAVISREVARELWGATDPIGQRVALDRSHSFEIVGVAADAPSDIAERAQALMVYRAWHPAEKLYQPFVRADRDPDRVGRNAAGAIMQRFAGAVAAPRTVEAEVRMSTDAFQRIGVVVGSVAAIAALLAIVGVYGVIALAAKRRLKEMGIRIALGARPAHVYRAMIQPDARAVVIGLLIGSILATTLAAVSDRLLAAVFPVRIVDPIAFVIAGLSLAAAALVAMLVPARRVASLEPARVLRQD
ncbi:MAG TPA: ABC transporter permease [Gemmatimonadaceae bacterium]|nr:ABC transporter permease [Gemmatimonadaceae bacterium]